MSEEGKLRRAKFYALRVKNGLSVPKQVTVEAEEPPKPKPKPVHKKAAPKKEEVKKNGEV